MKKLVAIAFILLSIPVFWILALSSDFVSSVIPGWHTTVYGGFEIMLFLVILNLLIPSGIYYTLHLKNKKPSYLVLSAHILVSALVVTCLKFPAVIPAVFTDTVSFDRVLSIFRIFLWLFLLEQVAFYSYIIWLTRKPIPDN